MPVESRPLGISEIDAAVGSSRHQEGVKGSDRVGVFDSIPGREDRVATPDPALSGDIGQRLTRLDPVDGGLGASQCAIGSVSWSEGLGVVGVAGEESGKDDDEGLSHGRSLGTQEKRWLTDCSIGGFER